MSKFRKKDKGDGPAISTASLPDIVFMLLFFFMVTTVMREVTLIVDIDQPAANEVQKLENKALVDYIYIGVPMDSEKYGTEPRIQLDDDFANLQDIPAFIISKRENRDEKEVPRITTSLKVDKETKMGIITDIKQELRNVWALKLNYSTRQGFDN